MKEPQKIVRAVSDSSLYQIQEKCRVKIIIIQLLFCLLVWCRCIPRISPVRVICELNMQHDPVT